MAGSPSAGKALTGEHQGLIVGHIAIAGSGSDAECVAFCEDDPSERCIACGQMFRAGDLGFRVGDGRYMHPACAGPEGAAAIENGARPAPTSPEGIRALGTSAISQAALAQAAARIAREASSWAADTLDYLTIDASDEPAPAATVRRFISRIHDRLRYLDRRAFGSEAEL
jgi:hypothetical protein